MSDPRVKQLFGYVCGIYKARWFNSRVVVPKFDESKQRWTEYLSTPTDSDGRLESIGRAYDGAIGRVVRIESKAVGLLQVVAIGFAVIALALTQPTIPVRALSGLALLYLVFSTWAAIDVLRVRAQPQILSSTAQEASPLASTAAAADVLEAESIRTANLITGAIHDLTIAGIVAGAALLLIVAGVGK